MDALLCWPALVATGPKASHILIAGGWHNGAWTPALRRTSTLVNGSDFEGKEIRPYDPEPLDRPVPPPWHFIDAPAATLGARLEFVQQLPNRLRYLPRRSVLTGLEKQTPHLRRADGQAVMFLSGLDSFWFRGEDYQPRAILDYVDEDVLLRFWCEPSLMRLQGSNVGAWMFDVAVRYPGWGLRDRDRFDPSTPTGLPHDLFPSEQLSFGHCATLSHHLWRKVSDALIDGWLNWTGSALRLSETQEWIDRQSPRQRSWVPRTAGVNLGARPVVHVKGGYIGGIETHRYEAWTHRADQPLDEPQW